VSCESGCGGLNAVMLNTLSPSRNAKGREREESRKTRACMEAASESGKSDAKKPNASRKRKARDFDSDIEQQDSEFIANEAEDDGEEELRVSDLTTCHNWTKPTDKTYTYATMRCICLFSLCSFMCLSGASRANTAKMTSVVMCAY
jgi:hypothetical protein